MVSQQLIPADMFCCPGSLDFLDPGRLDSQRVSTQQFQRQELSVVRPNTTSKRLLLVTCPIDNHHFVELGLLGKTAMVYTCQPEEPVAAEPADQAESQAPLQHGNPGG
jgi:hypothetical protein